MLKSILKKMAIIYSLVLFLLLQVVGFSFAEDAEIESSILDFREAQLEINGNLDGKWIFIETRQDSALYKLNLYNDDLNANLSQYIFELFLNGDYENKNVGMHLKTHSAYYSKDELDFTIFEAYNRVNIAHRLSFEIGKRMYSWGKGYAFNPVGYFNPDKDPENPESIQEGILAPNVEFISGFDSNILRTFSFTFLVVPPLAEINNRYGEINRTEYGSKIYFLFLDTDIDFMGYYKDEEYYEIGSDLSRNITDYVEVHAELSYYRNKQMATFLNNSMLFLEKEGVSYVTGLRIQPLYDITIICEYYHNDIGLTKDEYRDYLSYLENSYNSGDQDIIQQAQGNIRNNFNSQTLMRDYAYLKITKQDLLGVLYLSISPSIIYNLNDNSYIVGPEISYKPYTNFELITKMSSFVGDETSEYGSKQNKRRYEIWLRTFF